MYRLLRQLTFSHHISISTPGSRGAEAAHESEVKACLLDELGRQCIIAAASACDFTKRKRLRQKSEQCKKPMLRSRKAGVPWISQQKHVPRPSQNGGCVEESTELGGARIAGMAADYPPVRHWLHRAPEALLLMQRWSGQREHCRGCGWNVQCKNLV